MFKISAIGPDGHMIMTRNTPSEALRKAVELAGAGFGNVRIADRMGLLYTPRPSSGSSSKERATTTPWGLRGPHQSYSLEWDVMCVLSGSDGSETSGLEYVPPKPEDSQMVG